MRHAMTRLLKQSWLLGLVLSTSVMALQAEPTTEVFTCDDGQEIPISQSCDFIADCDDGSDEGAHCANEEGEGTPPAEEPDTLTPSEDATVSEADVEEEANLPGILANTEVEEEEEWTGCRQNTGSGALPPLAFLTVAFLVARWTLPNIPRTTNP
jgi:hypothetical protein